MLWFRYCLKSTLSALRSAEQLRENFPTVFHGVGKLKGYQAMLHVDVEVPPVAQRQRRILYSYVQAVDKKLEELLSTNVTKRQMVQHRE